MTLLRFIVIALIVWLAVAFVQRLLRQRRNNVTNDRTSTNMVRCAHCGLHLPQAEAHERNGLYFCSRQHLERHVDN